MNDWTKNTSRGRWKSGNRKPSDSQIPTTPAAATFLRPPQNQTHAIVFPISPVCTTKGSGQECPLYTTCLFWHQLGYG